MPKQRLAPSRQPPAVGYLRVEADCDEAMFAELLKEIAVCCLRENVRLVQTFTDFGYGGTQLARPGVMNVRDALVETEGLTVVVLALDDLSPTASIREPLIRMIHRLGGRLIVARTPELAEESPPS